MSSVNDPVSSVAITLTRLFYMLLEMLTRRRVRARGLQPMPRCLCRPGSPTRRSAYGKWGFRTPRLIFYLIGGLLAMPAAADDAAQNETLAQLTSRLAQESVAAYNASPFSEFSRDYFARFSRDPEVKAAKHEVAIDSTWQVSDPPSPSVCA